MTAIETSPAGALREQPVPCSVCRAETFNFSARCDAHLVRRFSTFVVSGPELVADHPDGAQQRRLAEAARSLPAGYALAYCTDARCEWYVRRPVRLGDVGVLAYQHLHTAHFDALLDGRACVDPDLVDGGVEHLAARMRCLPPRLRRVFEAVGA